MKNVIICRMIEYLIKFLKVSNIMNTLPVVKFADEGYAFLVFFQAC